MLRFILYSFISSCVVGLMGCSTPKQTQMADKLIIMPCSVQAIETAYGRYIEIIEPLTIIEDVSLLKKHIELLYTIKNDLNGVLWEIESSKWDELQTCYLDKKIILFKYLSSANPEYLVEFGHGYGVELSSEITPLAFFSFGVKKVQTSVFYDLNYSHSDGYKNSVELAMPLPSQIPLLFTYNTSIISKQFMDIATKYFHKKLNRLLIELESANSDDERKTILYNEHRALIFEKNHEPFGLLAEEWDMLRELNNAGTLFYYKKCDKNNLGLIILEEAGFLYINEDKKEIFFPSQREYFMYKSMLKE